ncbi:GTP:AMP phosphotransferase AK3, mitochondrial [Grifola frondosa]|uniref:GTP:AMP phosphotransferase AK3, mitochondrial n=1 Tax=Grifola frondosa TaxID=5627 RepID=A0A1C7MHS4_GRIFR|nr:GTP:AMP phosphotransferase AK3, mitochondrial [Grifola frondosa]
MEPVLQKILVVGGNGFLGSAVCRTALARGMQVTSISSSGRPYKTPKGHSPAWTSKVEWHTANALEPESYAHLLPGMSAVVHTIGTLFEKTPYKAALRRDDVPAFLGSVASSVMGGRATGNPLEHEAARSGSYEQINRDTALRVCEAFLATAPPEGVDGPRAFVFVSAEDCTRPFVSARYIETKREAEVEIDKMIDGNTGFRGVYIRPSLIYHPHIRPIISPVAALLDLSATIHNKIPAGIPTPGGILRSLGAALPIGAHPQSLVSSSPLDAIANALTIPPIHVDHVAEAICIAVDNKRPDVRGRWGEGDEGADWVVAEGTLEYTCRAQRLLHRSSRALAVTGSIRRYSRHRLLQGTTSAGCSECLSPPGPKLKIIYSPLYPTFACMSASVPLVSIVRPKHAWTPTRGFRHAAASQKAIPFSLNNPRAETLSSNDASTHGEGRFLRMLMFGKPGAGKGTLSARLVKKYDILSLSTGDLLRQHIAERTDVGRLAEQIVATGGLLPDDIMLKVVTSKLDLLHNKHWILDGFPRTLGQGKLLDDHLRHQGSPLSLVVNLDVADEVILSRISDRWVAGHDDETGEPLTKRPDDNPAIFARRLEQFYASTSPLLAYYSTEASHHTKSVSIAGATSDEIWPQLDGVVRSSFPVKERPESREQKRRNSLSDAVLARRESATASSNRGY